MLQGIVNVVTNFEVHLARCMGFSTTVGINSVEKYAIEYHANNLCTSCSVFTEECS